MCVCCNMWLVKLLLVSCTVYYPCIHTPMHASKTHLQQKIIHTYSPTSTHIHTYHTYTHIHPHVHTYIYTNTRIHIYTHTHILTYTHPHFHSYAHNSDLTSISELSPLEQKLPAFKEMDTRSMLTLGPDMPSECVPTMEQLVIGKRWTH